MAHGIDFLFLLYGEGNQGTRDINDPTAIELEQRVKEYVTKNGREV